MAEEYLPKNSSYIKIHGVIAIRVTLVIHVMYDLFASTFVCFHSVHDFEAHCIGTRVNYVVITA